MPNFQAIADIATKMIMSNPQMANNPQVQEYMNIIRSGDSARGEQIAENLCKTYGVTKEQAMNQAMNFFGLSRFMK